LPSRSKISKYLATERIKATHEHNEESARAELKPHFFSLDNIQQDLGKAQSIDDFFGKEGIPARLFAKTLERMLEAELTAQLGYEKYEAKGRNSGNSHNGKRPKKLRTSAGDTEVQLPRDLWHLQHRIIRKVPAHTLAIVLYLQLGRSPLDFDGLLAV
jgi:hypothetical protein